MVSLMEILTVLEVMAEVSAAISIMFALPGLCEKPTQENGQKPTMQRHGKQTREKTS
jgi:hypothetical protein